VAASAAASGAPPAPAAAPAPAPVKPAVSFEERRAAEEAKGGRALPSANRMRYVLYAGGALLMVTHAAAAVVAIATL
jgi:hypothetical protein